MGRWRTLGTGYHPGIAIWRDVLCCIARLFRMPVLPVTGYLRSFRGPEGTCILDLNAGESKAPARMMGDERETDFPRPQFPPCGVRAFPSELVTLVCGGWRRRVCAGNSYFPGDKCTTDLGFPRASHTPGEKCAAELDFPRASLTLGECCCAEELGYIRPALLAESPVYAWTVTGSLLFRSPHRRVWAVTIALSHCEIELPIPTSHHHIGSDVYGSWIVLPLGLCYSSLGKISQLT